MERIKGNVSVSEQTTPKASTGYSKEYQEDFARRWNETLKLFNK